MRTMFDSTAAADIPASAEMVAGYVDGIYRWSNADWARFPNAVKVRIACFATTDDGDVLDVETGDATPGQAPGWASKRWQAGVTPVIYCNRSNLAAVRAFFSFTTLPPPLIWLSTLDGARPWQPGVVAIQYAGSALSGGHYDLSDVSDQWPGLTRTLRRMLILRLPDGAEYLLSGSLLAGINDAADAQALIGAGVPVASIDAPFLASLQAAAKALAGGLSASGKLSGTLTVGA